MHPWYGIGFLKRKERAPQMREWLRNNEALRIHHGTTREDGKRFLGYGVGYSNGEHWVDVKTFERRAEGTRKKMRELRKTDAYKARFNSYVRNRYRESEEFRLKAKKRLSDWAADNKSRIAQRSSARRALKRSQLHPAHDFVAEAAMHDEARQLTLATGIEHHVDHIIPIKHGGWHHHENMQVLPEPVNLGKSSDPFWLSEDYKDFKDVPSDLWPASLADFYLAQMTT
jgi:5-methylcytosine-specific restriction endonuclease McrA